MVKLTVIMSTYNADEFLDEALSSLTKQTFRDFVVKIVDDNSTDNTVSIINNWTKKDKRIKLVKVNNKNRGLTQNLNELINESTSEYIARMDSDDISLPERFEKQIAYLENNKQVSIVGTWAFNINKKGVVNSKRYVPTEHDDIFRMIGKANPIIHPTVMFRLNDIKKIGGYDGTYRVAQDYDLWFRSMANGLLLANIPSFLFKYRVLESHVSKRRMKHRILDAKIRWKGTKALKFPLRKRLFYTSIPIILGLMPDFLKKLALKFSKVLDPRQRLGAKEEQVLKSESVN
ncbi:glycosyltransferase [Bacillus sp. REN3]|uniref:glycosyltransferase n=1 Tax=Bacillus sp. REN3 TaxID=2802440 RepID=UPI001AEDEF4E|nr:glycosyltransferase [Bacillus sp. REN3]